MDSEKCVLCPRACKADRAGGRKGACLVTGTKAIVSRAALHFWEEPCISGTEGSGTVFFSGCNLHCVYCQNSGISGKPSGKMLTPEELAETFIRLQGKKANNINLVTPTHYTPQIKEAILIARGNGLSIPIVYNCSGYESVRTLKMMDGLIDIYLTDFKYMDAALGQTLSHVPDYPERAKEALSEMVRQVPEPEFDGRGMMKKGVIVRHLLLPAHVKNAVLTAAYLYETYGDRIWISLMNQYTPVKQFEKYTFLNRRTTKREYKRLIDFALELGIKNAFIQEGKTAEESFIPSFDGEGLENLGEKIC